MAEAHHRLPRQAQRLTTDRCGAAPTAAERWVELNYLRAQTLSRANARLVEYHSRLPLAQMWGGGELASADGLRFITPIRTLNSGPNPKYFGTRRHGATFYNFPVGPVQRTARHPDPRHRTRLVLPAGRHPRTGDLAAARRGHLRHPRRQRTGLRPLPAPGLPVLPAPGRRRQRDPLPRRPRSRLRRAQLPHPRPGQPPADQREQYEDLWGTVYAMDRMYSARDVPVRERDLQCGGVCQQAGDEAS